MDPISSPHLPYNLAPVWKVVLDIYREFAAICQRHSLRHYAAFGTALGAVRHKGFIPWDDDFDVMMPRPDYERLIEIAPSELPAHLQFLSKKTTPGCQQKQHGQD